MIYTIILVPILAFMMLAHSKRWGMKRPYRDSLYWRYDTWWVPLAISAIVLGAATAAAFVASIVIINTDNDVRNSGYVLAELQDQRDELLATFEDSLTNEDFITLMNASVPDDVKFLRHYPEVGSFLLGRADRLVGVNARYFELRQSLLGKAKSVCNWVQNPLAPQIPFIGPDCRLGELSQLVRDHGATP